MNSFFIIKNKKEIVGTVQAKDNRDALVKFFQETPKLSGASITQDQSGRRYFLEHGSDIYRAEKASYRL